MMLRERLQTLPQYVVPQHLLSRLVGLLTDCRHPAVKNWCIQTFIKKYNVDMSTAIHSDPLSYPDFNSFFTRLLKPEARPITQGEKVIVSPADGVVSQAGLIKEERIFQAKGFDYDLRQLVGGCPEHAELFSGGHFATIYLAPKDYHRVHMPLAGELKEMLYVPGCLFSVNPRTTRNVPALFARNERVVCLFETAFGPMAMIMIGAMLVASIHMKWAGKITPAKQRLQVYRWQYAPGEVSLQRGEEMGYFNLGSTVVVLFGPNAVHWQDTLKEAQVVQMGELIGNAI